MSKLEIIEDNEFFTAGIVSHEKGFFTPFFQDHEKEDAFEEEAVFSTKKLALLRLAEIVIDYMDIITAQTEDLEGDDSEPSVSLVGGTLPLKEDF
jgi:hypothetical protein